MQTIPAITTIKAVRPYVVRVTWDCGVTASFDLAEWLNKSEWFAPVNDPAVWKSIRKEHGGGYMEREGC
ncbi:hypothetical protein DSM19430T_22250 [Desulfovibrio psychrotolerans]|uniref:DUF2442 domain-containing protein n=1 Tax=Desulfovibrio psychrotolerans TaxID=415242 RepID=A0A7J0BWK4_9BACT|nr:hypothetical protein DSM19430T_22250 [Desulfovibrio psychrotolerans]